MKRTTSANLYYVLRDAMASVKGNLATTALCAVTVGFSLAIFAVFLMLFLNLSTAMKDLGDRTRVVVYVKDNVKMDAREMVADVKSVPGVVGAEYISKEAAFLELKKSLGTSVQVLSGVGPGVLPASIEARVDEAHLSPEKLDAIVSMLGKMSWADEVQFAREWAEKFASFIRLVEFAAIVIGVFLAVAALFIISNTIRLTVYARKEELEILRLVGASDLYIKAPFFIEGVLQGAIGGVLALGFVYAGFYFIGSRVPEYLSFAVTMPMSIPALLGLLIASGIILGVGASLISMSRFMKV